MHAVKGTKFDRSPSTLTYQSENDSNSISAITRTFTNFVVMSCVSYR